jgi:RNA polymerase sigma-70 factor (sigma-E family)
VSSPTQQADDLYSVVAESLADAHWPDGILTDIRMSKLGGLFATRPGPRARPGPPPADHAHRPGTRTDLRGVTKPFGGPVRKECVDQGSVDFANFYQESRAGCLRAVYASVGDRQMAEELVSEAYARAWASWHKVGRHPAPRAWIVRTALNVHVSWWRRRRREVAWEGQDIPVEADWGGDLTDGGRVMAALQALPRRQRQIVALRVLLDLDVRTTADTLGISVGAVKSQLHQATSSLRSQLGMRTETEARL